MESDSNSSHKLSSTADVACAFSVAAGTVGRTRVGVRVGIDVCVGVSVGSEVLLMIGWKVAVFATKLGFGADCDVHPVKISKKKKVDKQGFIV